MLTGKSERKKKCFTFQKLVKSNSQNIMARKKEQALQVHLTSDSLFDNYLAEEGKIKIIDVFQNWTGQCKSILASMKKMKVEMQDPRLSFATGCCDDLTALEVFRGSSPEPIFLIFYNNILVDFVRGCNINLMQSKVKTICGASLDKEYRVVLKLGGYSKNYI